MRKNLSLNLSKGTFFWTIAIVFLLLTLFWLNSLSSNENSAPSLSEQVEDASNLRLPTAETTDSIKVDYPYFVSSIDDELIVLQGQKGEFVLPNDPSRVTFFRTYMNEKNELPLSDLTVGNMLTITFRPGDSAVLIKSDLNTVDTQPSLPTNSES